MANTPLGLWLAPTRTWTSPSLKASPSPALTMTTERSFSGRRPSVIARRQANLHATRSTSSGASRRGSSTAVGAVVLGAGGGAVASIDDGASSAFEAEALPMSCGADDAQPTTEPKTTHVTT